MTVKVCFDLFIIKKESPNEGTETTSANQPLVGFVKIKKESPNEGTETRRG